MGDENPIKIKSRTVSYQGYYSIVTYEISYRLFNGQWSPVCSREVFERGEAAAVLLYDPGKDKVVLLQQFRMGALKEVSQAWMYELVAGVIEPDELVSDVALREIHEETGVMVEKVTPICEYYPTPGSCSEKVHLFYSLVDSDCFSGVHGLVAEGEDIKLYVVSRSKAYQMLLDGKIVNGNAIIGLQWLQLNYKKLAR